jgi:NACHT domain
MLATAATISTTARLLSPIINDIYKGAKKAGAKGFDRWDVTTFPKKFAKRLRVIEEIRTLWNPDKDVSLLDFYYPSKVIIQTQKKPLARLSELSPGNTVIEGIVGQGKSILLRYLAMQEIISNDAQSLPIFIELRTLTNKLSLRQAIVSKLCDFDITVDDDSLSYLYKSGRVCILLDGFDELDEILVRETLTELEGMATKYPELQIVITSRPNNEIQKSISFKTVRIVGLANSDFSPFLSKLGLDATKVSQIKEAIRKSPSNVSELITTPLMLTLVVMVYESEKEIPETLPEFFDRLFRVVFTRHDRLKAAFARKHHSGLSERRLQELFEAFCFMVMQNGFSRTLSYKQFQIAFDQALDYSESCKCELEKFKQDITKVACLMLEEGLDMTTFLHNSIKEYYAAAFISHSMDEVAALFYSTVLTESKPWSEVLSFLKNIDPYRYSRDFAIPELEKIRDDFIAPLKTRKDSVLIEKIESVHPDLGILMSCEKDNPSAFSIKLFGPFNFSQRKPFKLFDDLLIEALKKAVPDELTRQQVLDIISTEKIAPSDEKEYSVKFSALLKEYGSKEFWIAIDIFEKNVLDLLHECQTILKNQQKRKLIFENKNSMLKPQST